MGNIVTNVCAKFNYDRLHIDKILGNWKSDDNNNKKNNIHSTLGPFPDPKNSWET